MTTVQYFPTHKWIVQKVLLTPHTHTHFQYLVCNWCWQSQSKIHLWVLLAICSLSTSMEARCSDGSMAICSSDNWRTCIMSCVFSWSDESFGMPVGIRFGSAACGGGAWGGGCWGFTRGSTRCRGSVWNGAGNERAGFDGGTVIRDEKRTY